jgi:two-component system chemotaxis response regulator CheB
VRRVETCLARRNQPRPAREALGPRSAARPEAPFACVVVAASTGGPSALSALLASLPVLQDAAVLVVLHGPAWLLETLVTRLGKEARMKARLAEDGIAVGPGEIFVARGDRHLVVEPVTFALRLLDQDPENFVRPAADPLLRSAARAFGPRCIAVVLTGMGRDGASGCARVIAEGGVVLAQDPSTASAKSMPQTVIDLGLATAVAGLEELPSLILEHVAAR